MATCDHTMLHDEQAIAPSVRAALLSTTAAPHQPDADLVTLAAQFVRDYAAYEAGGDFEAEPGTERADNARRFQEAALAGLSSLGERILVLPPTMPAGLAAWATVMGAWDQDNAAAYNGEDPGLNGRLLQVLLERGHLIGLGVAQSAARPDASLITLAQAHGQLGREFNADFPTGVPDDHPLALAAAARRNENTAQREESWWAT